MKRRPHGALATQRRSGRCWPPACAPGTGRTTASPASSIAGSGPEREHGHCSCCVTAWPTAGRGSRGKRADNSYGHPQADDLTQGLSAAPLTRWRGAPEKRALLRSPGNCPTVNGSLFLQIHILLTLTSLYAQAHTGEGIMWIFPKWAYTQELSFSSVVHVIFSDQE